MKYFVEWHFCYEAVKEVFDTEEELLIWANDHISMLSGSEITIVKGDLYELRPQEVVTKYCLKEKGS